jgi:hypothetical protein
VEEGSEVMDNLITNINALTTYPNNNDLHKLAMQIKQYSEAQQGTVLAALTNPLLVTDIKRMLAGALPSTPIAPVFVQPTAPGTPDHPGADTTTDPSFAKGVAPQIKPPAA